MSKTLPYSMFPILVTALLIAGSPAHASEALRVVIKPAPPFAIQQEDGSWAGISVDLWKQIATTLNFETRWIPVSDVQSQIDLLTTDQADIAVGALTVTSEREQRIDFSTPSI